MRSGGRESARARAAAGAALREHTATTERQQLGREADGVGIAGAGAAMAHVPDPSQAEDLNTQQAALVEERQPARAPAITENHQI